MPRRAFLPSFPRAAELTHIRTARIRPRLRPHPLLRRLLLLPQTLDDERLRRIRRCVWSRHLSDHAQQPLRDGRLCCGRASRFVLSSSPHEQELTKSSGVHDDWLPSPRQHSDAASSAAKEDAGAGVRAHRILLASTLNLVCLRRQCARDARNVYSRA